MATVNIEGSTLTVSSTNTTGYWYENTTNSIPFDTGTILAPSQPFISVPTGRLVDAKQKEEKVTKFNPLLLVLEA